MNKEEILDEINKTKSYIADINEIMGAELVNNEGTTIMLTFKTGDNEVVECDSVHNCIETFERFCDVCGQIATNIRQGELKMKKAKDSKEYDTMLFDYIEKELGNSKQEIIKRNKKKVRC
jgi:HSP90 family molecular chaperone